MIVRAPKAVRFHERPVDLGGRGVQRLADQQSGQQRIDQDRAIAVVPVERQQTAFAGLELLGSASGSHGLRPAP